MQIKILRQSMTIDLGSTATNVAVPINYVYLTNIPIDKGQRFAISIIKHVESNTHADKVYNLQLVADDASGNWVFKFTSKQQYLPEYTINAN
jgi:hypothetical protein